jgi:hypothetical protein
VNCKGESTLLHVMLDKLNSATAALSDLAIKDPDTVERIFTGINF